MTTKTITNNLVWRLQNKLTLDDIEKMLQLKIINEDEAKQLTFNSVKSSDEVKALKEQVKFLKELVERLTTRPQTTWTYYSGFTPSYGWSTNNLVGSSTAGAINAVQTSAISGTTLTTGTGVRLGEGNKIK